jgi:low temperature requirement protein LtrA
MGIVSRTECTENDLMSRTFLRPPALRTRASEHERSASWLELFYDLVFVVAVANLGKRLLDDVDLAGTLSFVGLFIPLWWAWASFTFYVDRYDTDDLGQRVLAVFQMIAVALMAASISGDTDSTAAFAASYVLARVVLILMYVRARRHVVETRELVTGYIQGFSIGAGIWLLSVAVPGPWRFFLWAIALAVEFGTPFYFRKIQAKVPLDASHLPERFGLFTILVLGESIAAAVAGLSHKGWKLAPTVAAIVGVVIASSLWWLYFDNLDGTVVRRKPEQAKAWKPTAWIYAHLPLANSLVAAGIGVEFIIEHASDELPATDRWLVFGGTAVALMAMGLMHVATVSDNETRRDELRARIRFASAALLIIIGLVTPGASALTIAVLVMVVLIAQVALDVAVSEQARAG